MPSSCGAYGCTNRGTDKTISFHRLPSLKKKDLREKWLRNIRRAGSIPDNLLICSEHFETCCFKRDLKVRNLTLPSYISSHL